MTAPSQTLVPFQSQAWWLSWNILVRMLIMMLLFLVMAATFRRLKRRKMIFRAIEVAAAIMLKCPTWPWWNWRCCGQGCIFRLMWSHRELTKDHVLTSAYVKILRTVTRNAVNKSVWRKKDCSWPPLNKYAMNIWLSSLRIRAHLSWRTGKHLHVLHVLRTYSTSSYPGYQDTTTYAALLSLSL